MPRLNRSLAVIVLLSVAINAKAIEWKEDFLLNESDASFYSAESTAYLGQGGVYTLDINGDDQLDIVVSAPGADVQGQDTGGIFLVLSAANFAYPDTDLGAHYFIYGELDNSMVGEQLSAVGDIDGDGYQDLLVAAPRYSVEIDYTGIVYIVFGAPSGWIDQPIAEAATSTLIRRDVIGSIGNAVAGAGDVNGDGYDDILIGGPQNEGGGHHNGTTYLVLGHSEDWSTQIDLDAADASFDGETSNSYSGGAVSGAGDTNGDGYSDFLIGNSIDENYSTHKAHLVLGAASGWAMHTPLTLADASFVGEAEADCAGHSVAGVSDLDGDGFDDILIGSPRNDEAGTYAGQVYLFFGKDTAWATDINLGTADASITGEDGSNLFGRSLSSAGDLNADGFSDILIGASGNGEYMGGAGQTYVFFGGQASWSMDTPADSAEVSFVGEQADDASGWFAIGGGDIDDDGFDDILVTAPFNDEAASEAGQLYLLYGTNCFDQDGDGFGNPGDATCPEGADLDCDDLDAAINPGAVESCNGIDDNCDGSTPADELDDDADGVRVCEGDCDDLQAAVYPEAVEVCDYLDNDCDGEVPSWDTDLDGDGTSACDGDCHDGDATLYVEDLDGDGVSPCDGDCDDSDAAMHLEDEDGDGFSPCDGDCDDEDTELHPAAEESCNGEDDDCDGELPADEMDADGDNSMVCDGDCDDEEPSAHPGALELCDGVDNDCNGEVDEIDGDGDGFGPTECGGSDCNDSEAEVNPTSAEDCGDGVDNDCDGLIDDQDEECADSGDDDDIDDIVMNDDTDDMSGSDGCECAQSNADHPTDIVRFGSFVLFLAGWLIRRR